MMDTLKSLLLAFLVKLGLVQKPSFVVIHIGDHPPPETVAEGGFYVVGHGAHAKWAYIRDPADKREIIQLSLMQSRHPCWQVSTDLLGRATVRPSVRQLDGSYAHFWIRKGAILWCEDSGIPPRGNRYAGPRRIASGLEGIDA